MSLRTLVSYISLAVLAILLVCAYVLGRTSEQPQTPPAANNTTPRQVPVARASYMCDGGKTIDAAFYTGSSTPGTDTRPPVPGGSVDVALSDGRMLHLMQTISADGARYSDGDAAVPDSEIFVFWNRSNGAFVREGAEQTYRGCVRVTDDPGGLPQVYESGMRGVSLRYPAGFVVHDDYRYAVLGPGREISGVQFAVPAELLAGTNLGADTYLSVETLSSATSCTPGLFMPDGALLSVAAYTDGDTEYLVASSTDAAAGNRYEETIFVLAGSQPCTAVRYFVHYGVFENYATGTVVPFDRAALFGQFDAMRRTLILE